MSPALEDRYGLSGLTALVTGAGTGIGRASALALAECGADVVLWDRADDARLAAVAAEAEERGVNAETIGLDLADTGAAGDKAREVASRRRIDVLVNNAGVIRRAPVLETGDGAWREVLAVNLDAVFVLSRELGGPMVGRGFGKIVNVASLLSFQGGLNVSSYAASKHAVAGLTRALANEWAACGVNVNAVAPGYIETNNTAPLRADQARAAQISGRIPAGRWGRPEDVAGAVAFLCSPAAGYLHGHVLVVDGGWMAW
jgi:2-deoxy-D-gluconate 3-dehydrogenase